jgi:mono/diheme cytochrome c family protein
VRGVFYLSLFFASLVYGEQESVFHPGTKYLVDYPVSTTRILIPYNSFDRFLSLDNQNPLKKIFQGLSQKVFQIKNFEDFYSWLGLSSYNENAQTGTLFDIPKSIYRPNNEPLGASVLLQANNIPALSFSCATCHAGEFMGKTILGLPNKGVRANRFYVLAKQTLPLIPSDLFQLATLSTSQEKNLFRESKNGLESVRSQAPLVLGLDTSLSHVGRSLAMRSPNSLASHSTFYEHFPRKHQLDHQRADSKPGVWWTLKYKNKWLSDGSIVSGNPVLTNILWNEIGRGADLVKFEKWAQENHFVMEQMTQAIKEMPAPHWSDFFPAEEIHLASAMRGEALFNTSCASCHGIYEKEWSYSEVKTAEELIQTRRVLYPEETPVVNVGTDENRWQGMRQLSSQLNTLRITQKNNIHTKYQEGYVPPPLVGIFARYPYMHNNSVPNLCAVLTPDYKRPTEFYQGPSKSKEDFDVDCVGYPVGKDIPLEWKKNSAAYYNTQREALSNKGHTFMLLNPDGSERFTPADKKDLIEYLKTL